MLGLIGAFRADPRPDKIDVGVGVYKDEHGATPVFAAVKEAEQRLLADQSTKGYLGPEGDVRFLEHLSPLVIGGGRGDGRISALQTPGGTGALPARG